MSAKNTTSTFPTFAIPHTNQVFDVFLQSLPSPSSPTCCAKFYIACIRSFCFVHTLSFVRSDRHDVLRATMRFLTHPRTDAEIDLLERSMESTCHCRPETKPLHFLLDFVPSLPKYPPTLRSVFEACASLLALCLSESSSETESQRLVTLDQARKRTKKADRKGQKALWPEKTHDVFVNPPETTLVMMWRLFYRYRSIPLLTSMNTLVHAAGSTLSSLQHKIPSFALQLLHVFASETASMKTRLGKLPEQQVDLERLVVICAALLQGTSKPFESSDLNAMLMWRPHADRVLLTLSDALATLTQLPPSIPNHGNLMESISNLGSIFVDSFQADPEVTKNLSTYSPLILRKFREHSKHGEVATRNPCVAAYYRLHELAVSDRCQNPGCTETFQTQNRRFQACGACKVVIYCSPTCQKHAWSYSGAPHRHLCGLLQAFLEKMKIPGTEAKSTELKDPEEIIGRCMEGGVSEDQSREICVKLMYLAIGRDNIDGL